MRQKPAPVEFLRNPQRYEVQLPLTAEDRGARRKWGTVPQRRLRRTLIISRALHHELTSAMQNQRGARPALMLPPESDCEGDLGGMHEVGARITPLAAPPEWLRNFSRDGLSALALDPDRRVEEEFWNEPPRYSLTGNASLLPASAVVPRSRSRVWATRFLFAALFSTVLGLLICELLPIFHC